MSNQIVSDMSDVSEQTTDKPVYSFCYGDRFQITNETTGEVIVDAENETDGLSTLLGLYEDAQAKIAALELVQPTKQGVSNG